MPPSLLDYFSLTQPSSLPPSRPRPPNSLAPSPFHSHPILPRALAQLSSSCKSCKSCNFPRKQGPLHLTKRAAFKKIFIKINFSKLSTFQETSAFYDVQLFKKHQLFKSWKLKAEKLEGQKLETKIKISTFQKKARN